ncbi:MAG: hypothetical protein ACI9R3_002777 [Verrucomicrobiales bacterium]|jgi:hypothetical protein
MLLLALVWAVQSMPAGQFDSEARASASGFGGDLELIDTRIVDGALQLTSHTLLENHNATAKLPVLDRGRIGSLSLEFDLMMFSEVSRPGDGMTLTFGEIPEGKGDGRHGFESAHGISIDFDTYNNGDDPSSFELIAFDRTVANVLFRFPTHSTMAQTQTPIWRDGAFKTMAANGVFRLSFFRHSNT